jgi:hypothetical protein
MTNSELYDFTQLEIKMGFSAEMDEFWSFVQNKGDHIIT